MYQYEGAITGNGSSENIGASFYYERYTYVIDRLMYSNVLRK